jgi:hypothetical protein
LDCQWFWRQQQPLLLLLLLLLLLGLHHLQCQLPAALLLVCMQGPRQSDICMPHAAAAAAARGENPVHNAQQR